MQAWVKLMWVCWQLREKEKKSTKWYFNIIKFTLMNTNDMTFLLLFTSPLLSLACLLLPDHDLSLLLVQQIKSINFLLRFLIAIKCNREESAMHEQFSFFLFLSFFFFYNYYLTWAYAVCLEFICWLQLLFVGDMQTWRFDEMTPFFNFIILSLSQ